MSYPSPPAYLRTLLILDACTSAAMALLLVALAAPLSPLLGLPAMLLRVAGALLVPFAAGVALVVQAWPRSRGGVIAVVLCNVAWVAASVGLLLAGPFQPTPFGTVFVLAQAAAVAAFALLQAGALRAPTAATT